MKKLLIILLCLGLVGCATYGKPIDKSAVEQMQKGTTTKEEVIKKFGQPDGTNFDKENRLIYYYNASKVNPSAMNFIPILNLVHSEMKMQIQMLVVVFSKEGIVEEYSFTDTDKPMKYGIIP
ncbi:MAG: outer membrane protein assembly factor BamE [Candidatus Omnitrophota bacterium]|nr:outer membrane protein assembly factor BamE [Candidatus Omnitrophota bacterium]